MIERSDLMFRIGFGYDVHSLAEGAPLILGGVEIPWQRGLTSHSDGDVVLHALMDALLGAACLGDIGVHFPDTDPKYKGCSSLLLLSKVGEMIRGAGYRVNNVDCTLAAQQPKVMHYIPGMREGIARVLGVAADQVNIKATTTEHLGFTGREEGMECFAVCTIASLP